MFSISAGTPKVLLEIFVFLITFTEIPREGLKPEAINCLK